MDAVGVIIPSSDHPDAKCLEVELVDGKRESFYWMALPEKVRILAVGRASGMEVPSGNASEAASSKKKKKNKQS